MKKAIKYAAVLLCMALGLGNGVMAQQAKPKSKQTVDPTKWQLIKDYSNDKKYGYLDKTGKMVIPATFDYAENFTVEGVAVAQADGKYGLIDKTGKWKVQPTLRWLAHCDNNLWWANKDGKLGFIDKTGKWTETQESRSYTVYSDESKFHEGLAPVINNDLWGFVDKKGKMVIEPQFTQVRYFDKGVCVVEIEGGSMRGQGKMGIIDKTGKWIVEPQYPEIGYFSEDAVCVATSQGKVGFMDRTGKWVVEPKFDCRNRNKQYGDFDGSLSRFEGGLASVLSNGKFGFIDKTGNWVIEPQFEEMAFFRDGYADVKINGKQGVIDKKGNWVVQPTYCGMQQYNSAKKQFVVYNCNGGRITGTGVIDVTGKVIIPLVYLRVEYSERTGLYMCSYWQEATDTSTSYIIDAFGKNLLTLQGEAYF